MRTDNNRNPTAMTTDVAQTGGLVQHLDYEQGDPFPIPIEGQQTFVILHTAKLLGDPVALTIRVIDKAGFYTHLGQQRWSYIAMPSWIWALLSIEEKTRIIGSMYKREGGSAM